MARSLSHLTGHELAALAAPYENPRYARAEERNLGRVGTAQKLDHLKFLSTELALASDILGKLEGLETDDDAPVDDLVEEYARAHAVGKHALRQAAKSPEQLYPAAGYLKHLRGRVSEMFPVLTAPSAKPSYARAEERNLGRVDNRQRHANLKLLSTEVALASDILGKLERTELDENELIEEYGRAHSAGRRALSQAEKRPEQVYPAAGYLKHLRGLMHEAFPVLSASSANSKRGMIRRNPGSESLSVDDVLSRFMKKLYEVDTEVEARRIIKAIYDLRPVDYRYEGGHYDAFDNGIFRLAIGLPLERSSNEPVPTIDYGNKERSVIFDQMAQASESHLNALQRKARERGVFFSSPWRYWQFSQPYIRKPDGKIKSISRAEAERILR